MAHLYATEKRADEALVLNSYNRICDGSKTNLFLVNGNDVYTPALSEGSLRVRERPWRGNSKGRISSHARAMRSARVFGRR